jgi:AcrR family transcriptional regulator
MILDAENKKITRSDKRAVRTRKKLEAAALEVFTVYGVDATTIEDITQKADLGKGTFYRHFKDKEDIATYLVDLSISELLERLQKPGKPIGTLFEALEHLLDAHYKFFLEEHEKFILLFQGRMLIKLERRISEKMEAPYSRYLRELEKILSPFIGEKIDPMKIRRLACAVAGFVFGFFSFAMIGMEMEQVEASIQPLRQNFVRSLSSFLGQLPDNNKEEKKQNSM